MRTPMLLGAALAFSTALTTGALAQTELTLSTPDPDTSEITARLARFGLIVGIVLVGAFFIALAVSSLTARLTLGSAVSIRRSPIRFLH